MLIETLYFIRRNDLGQKYCSYRKRTFADNLQVSFLFSIIKMNQTEYIDIRVTK